MEGCLRQIDFLAMEVQALDREIAKQALAWPEVLRLMSVPRVSVQTATAFMASSATSAASPRRGSCELSWPGPSVRQSGNGAARHGPICKEGASEARHMIGEIAGKGTGRQD